MCACVSTYQEHYDGLPLHSELVKQYQVDDDDLKHFCCLTGPVFMLSAMKVVKVVTGALHVKKKNDYKPPQFAKGNGYSIGHIPDTLKFKDKHGEVKT